MQTACACARDRTRSFPSSHSRDLSARGQHRLQHPFVPTRHRSYKLRWVNCLVKRLGKMPSPITNATLQAAALSTLSNLCAQVIEARQEQVRSLLP